MSNRRGQLIILYSPSGAGKSTLTKRLRAWDPSIVFSVSATTRAPRSGEADGVDYYFMTQDAFKSQAAEGEMLEHAEVFGNFYGSPKGPVEAAMNRGQDVLFDIDWLSAPGSTPAKVKYSTELPRTTNVLSLPRISVSPSTTRL